MARCRRRSQSRAAKRVTARGALDRISLHGSTVWALVRAHRIVEDGAEVATFSEVRHNRTGPPAAVVHFFRFEGDRIAELWDVGQEVPADSPNENGMF